ncbi:MAG: DUF3147 family protein [Acidobacteria bacterium]|nr:DUF3147 family protein [Acidobacteriota bacterium]MBV8891788.1 DUF3147 family protein [Acidobacteriota bacterium]
MRLEVKPIAVRPSALAETRWYQYAARFFLGGLITAMAGLIAKHYGPRVGGLFLAFPAIFPASATLIEKHERQHKAEHGLHGEQRARKAVGADAAGAAMGSVALIAFALVVWQELPNLPSPVVIATATLVWLVSAGLIWIAWKRNWFPHRGRYRAARQEQSSL